ncbi:zf-HC2 domain-containing protein [Streptomyces sp. NPDC002055]|uniref:zf-HC2 domain-containing protein n=1 Tax=Streptomyces sp. NPDC002055 TaxID=3154534 RepID=UPI0033182AC7
MQCSRIRTALSARADGEALPPDVDGPALDAHLAGCPECRRWERQVQRLREFTGSAEEPDPGADGLLAALRTALDGDGEPGGAGQGESRVG